MTSASALGRSARWATVEVTDLDYPQPRTQRRGHAAPRGAASAAPPVRFSNPFEPSFTSMDDPLDGLIEFEAWLARQRDLLGERRALMGRDLPCTCALDDPAYRRNVLLDVANPPTQPFAAHRRAMELIIRKPWAPLLRNPESLGSRSIEIRTWDTYYRGSALTYGGTRIDTVGISAAKRAELGTDWHTQYKGWLGAVVLVDVHPARNFCRWPWGQPQVCRDVRLNHWMFRNPHRLAERTRSTSLLVCDRHRGRPWCAAAC